MCVHTAVHGCMQLSTTAVYYCRTRRARGPRAAAHMPLCVHCTHCTHCVHTVYTVHTPWRMTMTFHDAWPWLFMLSREERLRTTFFVMTGRQPLTGESYRGTSWYRYSTLKKYPSTGFPCNSGSKRRFFVSNGSVTPREESFTKPTQVMLLR